MWPYILSQCKNKHLIATYWYQLSASQTEKVFNFIPLHVNRRKMNVKNSD